MNELQATVEFSVELYKFYNVDLFQRGYYQVRTSLRTSPRLASRIEICLPTSSSEKGQLGSSQLIFPPCIVNGSAVSKTFQILYRNEEVILNDVILFKAHLVVDSKKVEENLQKADFQLTVELWFTEQPFGPDHHSSIVCVSSRVLKLHLSPAAGLHHHLPVLFDYFHLSAVSTTVHGFLLAVHQPYVNSLRQAKATWLTNSPKVGNHVQTSASLESVIFGNAQTLKASPSLTRLNQARSDHRTVCTLLLSSYESLQNKLLEYMKLLPPWQQIKIEVTNCYNKLGKLKEITKEPHEAHHRGCEPPRSIQSHAQSDVRVLDVEDELLAIVNSDIAQLCAENIILWQQFLEAFTLKDRIQQHLAREHHLQRVKRFAEGFFVIENSRYSIFHCAEQMYQSYLSISESIRKTKYFSTLPSLGVECPEMDGGPETLPVIFEDHYQDLSRRKSSPDTLAKKKLRGNSAVSTTDVHLCLDGDQLPGLHCGKSSSDSDRRQSKTMPRAKESGGAAKKHKTVGCFSTGAAPKVHDDDACYGGRAEDEEEEAERSAPFDSSVPADSLVRRVGAGPTACSSVAVKKSFISAEELARIKEDFKLSVIESKIYKTVPEWNGGAATAAGECRGGQSRRQEMFRSQTSKSLSAVEEAASRFVRSQSAHGGGGAMPRLDTVPLFSPLRHLDGGPTARCGRAMAAVPPLSCLEDLRLHQLNSNAIATFFEIREFKSAACSIPAIREKEASNNNGSSGGGSNGVGSTKAVRLVPPPKLQQRTRVEGEAVVREVVTPAAPTCNGTVNRKVTPSRVVVVVEGGIHNGKTGDRPLSSETAVASETTVGKTPVVANGTAAVPVPVEFPDVSTVRPRDNLRLDLKSLNRMYDRANASASAARQQKEAAASKGKQRRPNGLQCLRLLKAQSPTCSTSSDSIILMSYKRLEQSESLPVGLSSVGQRVASLARRAGCGSREDRPAADGKRRSSIHRSASMPDVCPSPAAVDGVDSAIATDSEDRRRSLAASESMPDLGASESTTLEEFPVNGVAAATVDCHWSSCESMGAVAMVVAPNASSEESDSDDSNDNVEGDEVRATVVVNGVTNGVALEPCLLPTAIPVANPTILTPAVVVAAPRRRPRSLSRCSDSSSRSSSSVGSPSTSDSEHSGWVSSRRSSSDGSSAEATRRKPVRPPGCSVNNAAAIAKERHIYEEIHLPPEEFRDPPPLPAKRTSVPGKMAHGTALPPTEAVIAPVPAPRLPRGVAKAPATSGNVRHHHGTAEEHAPTRHHRRAESSSSHDTGYKSERPISRTEETSAVAAVHLGVHHAGGHHHHHHHHHRTRQRRPAAVLRPNVVAVPEPPPRGRTKARQRREPPGPFVTAAYLNAECTILEMLADTGPCSRVTAVNGAPTHPWRRRNGAEVEEEDDGEDTGEYSNGVEDELALVPAPPPPASRRAGSGKEDSVSPSTATECDGDAGSGSWLVSVVSHNTVKFVKAKEEYKRQLVIPACLYSDCPTLASHIPYFHVSEDYRLSSVEGLHLVICVHGLDGNSADLRLVRTYLELGLPCSNLEFLMSERNQGDTFSDFEKMTDKLVAEILYHIEAYRLSPSKISFIGHSLGNIIIRSALARPQMKPLLKWLHTFLSLSGPHLGTLYNSSGLVNMGLWFMQKWKKSGSLLQLSMKDASDIRHTFLYKLSQKPGLEHFRNILLFGSSQDRYVPIHSARIELCKAAMKDNSNQGAAYRDMVHGLLQPVARNPNINFVRYDVHHALPNTANSLIGRAAHIAVLDSELFIEKFLTVCGLKYFK